MDPDSLANQLYREQLKENWPGLVSECKLICEKLGLKDLTFTNEENIKIKINNACVKINEKWLRIKAQGKAKCARILRDPYGKKVIFRKTKYLMLERFLGLELLCNHFHKIINIVICMRKQIGYVHVWKEKKAKIICYRGIVQSMET